MSQRTKQPGWEGGKMRDPGNEIYCWYNVEKKSPNLEMALNWYQEHIEYKITVIEQSFFVIAV